VAAVIEPTVEWDRVREETWERFRAGDHAEVAERAERLLADGMVSAELHFLLAQCLHNGALDPDRAYHHYTRAGALGYDRHWVWANRGRLHREAGRPRQASRDLLLAFAIRPFGPSATMALREMARVLLSGRAPTGPRRKGGLSSAERAGLWRMIHAGDHADVISRVRPALAEGSDAELHYLLAHALHGAGEAPDQATAAYTDALNAGWDWYWVRVGRGRLHRECGRSAEALRDLVPALLRRPLRRSSIAVAKEIAATIVRWNRVSPRQGG
jgi:tetratricopeptide (TPR) repeat protein